MDEHEARVWLQDLVAHEAGFTRSDAALAVEAVFSAGEDRQLNAIALATMALATKRLLGGPGWWNGDGHAAKELVLSGSSVGISTAESVVAEAISPARDAWDPNWPEDKRFRCVEAPDGSKAGDMFIVGNGESVRGRFRVAERAGEFGAELVADWDVLEDERNHAVAALQPLLGLASVVPDSRSVTPEEIVRLLRRADELDSQGVQASDIAELLEVSPERFARWRDEYAGLQAQEIARRQEQRIEGLENTLRVHTSITQSLQDRYHDDPGPRPKASETPTDSQR